MFKNLDIKSTQKKVRLLSGALIAAACLLLAGSFGLVCLVFLYVARRVPVGIDWASKHGISQSNGSRLGGAAVAASLLFWIALERYAGEMLGFIDPVTIPMVLFAAAVFALPIALVGLADDLTQGLHAYLRLALFCILAGIGFVLAPELMPQGVLNQVIGFENYWLLLFFSSFCLVGFINAGNMVDGANGLLSVIAASFFYFCFWVTEQNIYQMITLALLVFSLVNLVTGKVMLGDFGAYGLSALMMLTAFAVYQSHHVSIFLFASLLCYPCIEIISIIVRRLVQGQSPFLSDNQHCHNLLYGAFSETLPPIPANSMTGLVIALISVLPAWCLLELGWNAQSDAFLASFLIQSALYLIGTYVLLRRVGKLKNNDELTDAVNEMSQS